LGEFVRVAKVADFRRGGRGRAVELDGKQVAIFRTQNAWIAVSDACPHMGASLADGKIDGEKIECAWHGWKFDTRTGKNAFKDWACVTVYAVRIEGDDVLLERKPQAAPDKRDPDAGRPSLEGFELDGEEER
jgi:nitrite reductase (NADH) small subunit/3-phenylpropionate/trans-cinnamate dioxygenase ferredoxin subunit